MSNRHKRRPPARRRGDVRPRFYADHTWAENFARYLRACWRDGHTPLTPQPRPA